MNKMKSTPAVQHPSMNQSLPRVLSPNIQIAPSITQLGARYCSQMVFAGDPTVTAERKDKFMVAKQSVIGTMPIFQRTLRTNGNRSVSANNALQNAIASPRVSICQTVNGSSCVKKPLELHKTDAAMTSITPNHLGVDGVAILMGPSSLNQFLRIRG